MSLVKKILVANRGEIACRIIRTAKRMGVQTVAIYSDIDRDSKFVDMADQAYRVGGNPSSESYLNKDKILQIALESGCEALHPGFGFLSENASFAQECDKKGVTFIGPPASAITAMGSKSESKKIMVKAGVPVVPGYHEDSQQTQHLYEQAEKIGYPVLIKAVSGGGGKGMRIVRKKQDFKESLESCQLQSLKSFSDDRVIIEKYITRPRHIQVQIFGDQFGNYVHLYERDCSIQRRHQKVVEEAPSNVSQSIREYVCSSAVSAAKAVGYYNAGTVQFIFDLDSNNHYFMEMNTRLQVEHPISEMITGYDFVEWQLLVASKFPLPKKQSEITKTGTAIEVRVYAQDPFNGFLPGSGTLKYFKEPVESNGVRIQTGVREHDTISVFYDPMIAKLITYGKTREQAIDLMKKALTDYKVVGLNNNLKFLKRILGDNIFRTGVYDTSFIQKYMSTLLKKQTKVESFEVISAVIARNNQKSKSINLPQELINFRNVKGIKQHHTISVEETSIEGIHTFNVQIEQLESNKGCATLNGKTHLFQYQQLSDGQLNIIIDGQIRKKGYFVEGTTVSLFDSNGDTINFNFESDNLKESKKNTSQLQCRQVKTPMPGTISKIYVKVGDVIKVGQPVADMSAMKMEHKLRWECPAFKEGRITKVGAKAGDFVQAHQIIVEMEPIVEPK